MALKGIINAVLYLALSSSRVEQTSPSLDAAPAHQHAAQVLHAASPQRQLANFIK
jgi:hypothetical protein